MQGLGDAFFEMDYRTKRIEAELEKDRLAHLAATSRPRKERLLGIRRMAARLGDLLVGLGCSLQARFGSEPGSVAC